MVSVVVEAAWVAVVEVVLVAVVVEVVWVAVAAVEAKGPPSAEASLELVALAKGLS